MTVMQKRKEVVVDTDEHPRPQTTLEGLGKLPLVFKKDGVVTAGTASVSYFLNTLWLDLMYRMDNQRVCKSS